MKTISVIIPVYGVEPYLRRCLDSVAAQTCRDLEILLVDDGSPDGCPAICDEYAAGDSRFRVIHKENGGLSDARNAGLAAATGEYIGFVDSDDWLEPDMYERLAEALERTGSEVAVCNFRCADERLEEPPITGVDRETILDRDGAVRLLLRDKQLQNYVWNKLYAAALWDGVRFPAGKAFEDIDTTWRVLDRAQRTVLIPYVGYNYFVRSGGIVQSRSIQNEIDCVEQGLARYEALIGRFPECAAAMESGILHTINKVWGLAWENRALVKERYGQKMARFAAFAREHLSSYAPEEPLGITGRLTLRLLPYARPWAYGLAHALNRLYLWKHPSPEREGGADEHP